MVATAGWRRGCPAMTSRNQSKSTSDSWGPEGSWKPRATGSWFGLPNARTTRFSAQPRWIGTARRSHGWEDCALSLSILDASDKYKIVIDFLSADFGDQVIDRWIERTKVPA